MANTFGTFSAKTWRYDFSKWYAIWKRNGSREYRNCMRECAMQYAKHRGWKLNS